MTPTPRLHEAVTISRARRRRRRPPVVQQPGGASHTRCGRAGRHRCRFPTPVRAQSPSRACALVRARARRRAGRAGGASCDADAGPLRIDARRSRSSRAVSNARSPTRDFGSIASQGSRGPQDVAAVEVLVADDGRILCLPELPIGSHPRVEEHALERTAEGVPARGELLYPACRLVRQQAERVKLERRTPAARENPSGCSVRSRCSAGVLALQERVAPSYGFGLKSSGPSFET